MIIKKLYPVLLVFMFAVYGLLPFFAMAAVPGSAFETDIGKILTNLGSTGGQIIKLLFVIASVVFLWGVVVFVAKADDEGARKKGRSLMMWGIVGMAVMASAWGLTALLVNYFGTDGGGNLDLSPTKVLPKGLFKTVP